MPPLIVDYKTDRLDGAEPGRARAAATRSSRTIYALAVAEARGASEVELAYVFLERPEEPVVASWGPGEIAAGRAPSLRSGDRAERRHRLRRSARLRSCCGAEPRRARRAAAP